MRVLVTGSSGRVGSAIVERLRGAHAVVGLDRRAGPTTSLVQDLREPGVVERALEGVDAIVHVAALHAPHVGVHDESRFVAENVAATARLVDAARHAGVRRFVYTSTTALYGHASQAEGRATWVDEALAPRPRDVYHRTKLAAEALLRDASASGALDVAVLRMARCFPEPAPLMAVYRLHRGVDARDVADAHARALEADLGRWQLLIVGAPTPFRPDDCAALWHDAPAVIAARAPALAEQFARRGWPLPARIDRVYDASRAERTLGWRARHGFEAVLAQLDAGSPEVLAPLDGQLASRN
jgi:nucleoside-diphosphate-sugar epimerase